jgi:hypothetical protein
MLYRKGQQSLLPFLPKNFELVYCSDVVGLLQNLGSTHNPEEWRLLVDSSKLFSKVVQLYNGNIHPSIPIDHCVHMKEIYENTDFLLKAIHYSKYEWKLCGDHKVIGSLLGMQSGYTKFCCFFLRMGLPNKKQTLQN